MNNVEEIQAKMENIQDPELKKIITEINEFMYPKMEELQLLMEKEKPGMFKMVKLIKNFFKDTQKEYEEKYGRSFEEDMKRTNEYLGLDKMGMLNILNGMS